MTCLCLGLSIGDDLFFELYFQFSQGTGRTPYSLFEMQQPKNADRLSEPMPLDAKAIDHCKYQQSQPISTLLSFPQVRLCITLSLLYVSQMPMDAAFRYPVAAAMVRKLC